MSAYALMVREPAKFVRESEHISLSQRDVAGISQRITLFTTPDLSWIAASGALLIGSLFERQSNRPVLDGADFERALETGLERFVRAYWGTYVLVLEIDGQLSVLRDPSGGIACYCGGGDGPDDATAMRLSEIATLERWLMSWRGIAIG